MHALDVRTVCLVIAVACEIVASYPPQNTRFNFMTLGFAFALLSLIVGKV